MEKHEDAWAGNGSSERAYRDETDDLEENGGDMDIDNVGRQDEDGELLVGEGKEKPRESGKHRSKDRKKGRREEKDHGSKDRGKLKEREKEDFSGKDSDKLDTRESDRMESRERRKENRSEYDKDREHEKDREKERSRDKIREKDYDRDKYRELERGKDRGRDRDKELDRERERSRSFDRELERGRDLGKDRGREREKDREIGREQESVRDYERGKEQDHVRNRDKDLERDRVKGHDRSRTRDKGYEKERQKELELERGKEKDHGRGMDQDHERGKDNERERERDRDRMKDRERGKEKIKDREKEREKEKEKDGNKLERDKGKERYGEKEKDKKWEMYRDKASNKSDTGRNKTRENDELLKVDGEDTRIVAKKGEEVQDEGDIPDRIGSKDHNKKSIGSHSSTSDLEERLVKMKVERLKRKSDGASEILSWVSKSRTLEEKKNAEKEKASRLSRAFEEQDNALEESEDEEAAAHTGKDLAGVKVLHGLDKVIEGGAVVLTLKDQNILANGDINEEIDMLENVELGEQKQRDEAYRAAKKKTGIYEDKFSDDTGMRKTILPQYDDPIEDEGVTLDESGRFTGEAEKKLEVLRKRIEGTSTYKSFEDLTSSGKPSSDYYTPDEMLQFKKPKKKKSLRKKDKLDLDALEAEAISAGLGIGDLGTRNDGKKQSAKEEREKTEAKLRSDSYQSAYAKAEEASKALRQEKTLTVKFVEDDNPVFGEDYEDLQRALEQARKLAFRGQDESAVSGPQAVALSVAKKEQEDNQIPIAVEPQENKVVITEMEEFVLGLQLNEESHKPEPEDVFKDEEDVPKSSKEETEAEVGGWTEVKDTNMDEMPIDEEKEDIAPDESIHEVAFGKGLSGALKLLKERGTLKESIDWGGRNMDKKKSKLVGIYENDGSKEIRIERTDEFGRIMTPKEAFRLISHKFHGKGPGKMKQEKRMKQFQEELKLKQMKASDTPSLSAERMREAQARLKSPYLVLSGHVKPGQTSDPRSGFATVEKDHLGSLTPMLGDKKVEHFLGISRKPDAGSMGPPPPKKLKS